MKNIILIGMPGAGKSTVGVVLAKNLGMSFMDSDLVIQERKGKKLHELITEFGNDGFLRIEGEVNASLDVQNTIIATGGSAVYSEEAMKHLKEIGIVVYLELSEASIQERLGDLGKRGVVLPDGWTLTDLYNERVPLYQKYADLVIRCDDRSIRTIVEVIGQQVEKMQR